MAATAFGVFVGVYAGGIRDYQKFMPRVAYERNIEGDSKHYLIIEAGGESFIMARKDSTEPFKTLEELYEKNLQEISNLNTIEMRNLREKLLSKD